VPIDISTIEQFVMKLNATRRPDHAVKLESFDPPGTFVLSYPDRPMPPEQCIDQDLSEIQFALLDEKKITTEIVAGALDPTDERYHMRYQVVEWD
jgi:hypothetical protein